MSDTSALRPGKRNLAMAQAANSPNTRLLGTAMATTCSESLSAATESGSLMAAR